ncbi:MAG: hypothetical protein QNL16_01350 [Rhodobacterales bacterium]
MKVAGHPRLYKRGNIYYHRAAIPRDIADTYGKAEETRSLRTKDHADAVRRVRIAASEADQSFDIHRTWVQSMSKSFVTELSPEQLATIKQVYFRHLLEEDEETRVIGFEDFENVDEGYVLAEPMQYDPRPTFEEHNDLVEGMLSLDRSDYARGKPGVL